MMGFKDRLVSNIPMTLKLINDSAQVSDNGKNFIPPLIMKDTLNANASTALKFQKDNNDYSLTFPSSSNEVLRMKDLFRVTTLTSDKVINAGNKIYGFKIEFDNPDPYSRVTYTDDSIEMTPSSNKWFETEIFKDIKPCLFKNGAVNYYLNPYDLSKKLDNTSSDISSGLDGDVMVEVPLIWVEVTDDSRYLYIKLSRKKPDKGDFRAYAHNRLGTIRDYVYRGCFESTIKSNIIGSSGSTLMSLATGELPTVNYSGGSYHITEYCLKNNRNRSYCLDYFTLNQLWQHLFILFYKTTNSKNIFKGNCTKTLNPIGLGIKKGPNWGSNTVDNQNMCFLWVENWYSNSAHWLSGCNLYIRFFNISYVYYYGRSFFHTFPFANVGVSSGYTGEKTKLTSGYSSGKILGSQYPDNPYMPIDLTNDSSIDNSNRYWCDEFCYAKVFADTYLSLYIRNGVFNYNFLYTDRQAPSVCTNGRLAYIQSDESNNNQLG